LNIGQLFLAICFDLNKIGQLYLVDLFGFLNWPTFSYQCVSIQTKLANFFGRSVWILKLANFSGQSVSIQTKLADFLGRSVWILKLTNFFGNLFRFKQNWPTFLVDLFGFNNWPTFYG
jgi:hypothetical protein